MHLEPYLVYLTAASVGMLTPGPAMLQAMTLGMRHGPRPVAAVALGNVCAAMVQVAAVFWGLSLLARSPWLLRLIGLVGAAYLAWLGLRLWRAPGGPGLAAGGGDARAAPSPASLFNQGALVSLANPKAWGFLTAMLPPCAAGGLPDAAVLAVLAAPIAVLAYGGMMAYAVFGSWLARMLDSPGAMRRFFRVMAATLWLCAAYFAGWGL